MNDERQFEGREVAVTSFFGTGGRRVFEFFEELAYLLKPLFHFRSPNSLSPKRPRIANGWARHAVPLHWENHNLPFFACAFALAADSGLFF